MGAGGKDGKKSDEDEYDDADGDGGNGNDGNEEAQEDGPPPPKFRLAKRTEGLKNPTGGRRAVALAAVAGAAPVSYTHLTLTTSDLV